MDFADKKIFKFLFFFTFSLVFFCSCENSELSVNTKQKIDKKKLLNKGFSLGTNLAPVNDWTSAYIFTDAFKHAREWVSNSPAKWDDGRQIFKDKNGWVNFLQREQKAATLIFTDTKNHYPSGTYTLRYKGKGKFKFSGAGFAGIISEKQGEILINLNSSFGGIIIEIIETNTKDYIRDIKFLFPGGVCEDLATEYCDENLPCSNNAKCIKFTEEKTTFHPHFLKNISIYSTLRFMDWQRINNSEIGYWHERAKKNYYTYTTNKGVPYEKIIELSNLLQKDPWICIPHLADDEYVEKLAELFNQKLDRGLKLYLEYSNETWNEIFKQSKFINKIGSEISQSKDAKYMYYASRAENIFDAWSSKYEKIFYRVLSAQAANIEVAKKILENSEQVDALAIAPYIANTNNFDDQLLNNLSLEATKQNIIEHFELAKKHNLDLISYEGGQHILPGKEKLELAIKLNKSTAMEQAYVDYLNIWKEEGGKLFMHYLAVDKCSQHGCWGAKESYLEPDELSPKYRALKNFAQK